ncbi:MAG: efflux RND transporter permease subunit, partial [Rhizobiales bacterium]|nr:efflux RND transporter permease subunit [Hyphomicrobiales bacterium]
MALLIVPALTLFELASGSVTGAWKGLLGLDIHKQIAAVVSADTNTFANKLVAKLFEIVIVLTASFMAFLAGLAAFKLIELPAGGVSRMARNTRWLTARFYDHRVWMLGIGWFSFLVTILLFGQIPGQFQPSIDDENSRVEIEMVPGTTLAETKRIVNGVAARLNQEPEVERLLERIRQGETSSIFVKLKEDRTRSSIEFERELAPVLAKFPDARVRFQSQSGGFGSGRDMTVLLAGSDPVLLDQTATRLVEEMKGLNTLVAPRISADLNRPEIIIT